MNNHKPFKDWTLGEVQKLCVSKSDLVGDCYVCPFGIKGICRVSEIPADWDLTEAPTFTDTELRHIATIRTLFPWAHTIARVGRELQLRSLPSENIVYIFDPEAFPSIQPGQTVELGKVQ